MGGSIHCAVLCCAVLCWVKSSRSSSLLCRLTTGVISISIVRLILCCWLGFSHFGKLSVCISEWSTVRCIWEGLVITACSTLHNIIIHNNNIIIIIVSSREGVGSGYVAL